MPSWNPINICSYHLQEAGATPVQELAYALSHGDRRARLGARLRPGAAARASARSSARISFFVNAGRAVRRGDVQAARVHRSSGTRSPASATASTDPKLAPLPLRRAGQLARADRGAAGEQRPAHRARDARGDAVQGRPGPRRPAAGLERGAGPAAAVGPAVVAADAAGAGLRDRPAGVRRPLRRLATSSRPKVAELVDGRARRDRPRAGDGRGGGGRRVRLHEGRSSCARSPHGGGGSRRATTSSSASTGSRPPSPARCRPTAPGPSRRRPGVEAARREALAGVAGRARPGAVRSGARRAARGRQDRHEPHGGHARLRPRRRHDRGVGRGAARGVRRVPGADRGVARPVAARGRRRARRVRERVRATGEELGERLRMLVGKPGLDGHSNGAEQVAVRARDVGFEVIYQGIRLTPAQIVAAAVQEDVHVVGLSVLSGSHLEVVPGGGRGAAGGRRRRRAGGGRRDHPAGRRRHAAGARGRRGVHAEGLRADGHHGRDRRPSSA